MRRSASPYPLPYANDAVRQGRPGDPLIVGWSRKIREDLEGQMRRGKLPWVDPEYLASAVVGVSFEVAVIMVDRDPVDVDGATAFAIDLFVGCMERAGRSARPPDG